MVDSPLVSFIVLSYNYRNYVVETIRSIFSQTYQNYEIIVVDDCSTDDSVEVLRTFSDRRLRIIVNETNLGGAGSYNVAVSAARGEYLVNLDADDWIAPEKTELQVGYMKSHPSVSVLGTYIEVVDNVGRIHSEAQSISQYCNREIDLNDPLSWIVENPLCRSSTMVRRDAHADVGMDDEGLVYACDYDLWLRFLKKGHRIKVMPEKLTFYRWHGKNVTHRDPAQQFLEITYLLTSNLSQILEDRSLFRGVYRIMQWMVRNQYFAYQPTKVRYTMLNKVFRCEESPCFASYWASVASEAGSATDEILKQGRRLHGLLAVDDRPNAEW